MILEPQFTHHYMARLRKFLYTKFQATTMCSCCTMVKKTMFTLCWCFDLIIKRRHPAVNLNVKNSFLYLAQQLNMVPAWKIVYKNFLSRAI